MSGEKKLGKYGVKRTRMRRRDERREKEVNKIMEEEEEDQERDQEDDLVKEEGEKRVYIRSLQQT